MTASLEAGVVAATVYASGRPVSEIAIDEASAWVGKPDHVVWIGLHEPPDGVLRRIEAQLGLSGLAIEDARRAHYRPKLEQYGDSVFIAARTAEIVDDKIELGETQILVGRGYVATIRHGASTSYAEVRSRCEACPDLLGRGEDYIVWSILDFIVDSYGPVIEQVQAGISRIEDDILRREPPHSRIEKLYRLRRNLLGLRDAITPLLDVCRRLEGSDVIAVDPEMQQRFRQLTHRVDRTRDDIDSLREVLAFAFEVSLMMGQAEQTRVQSQQTVITRQLAAWAAILAVPTAIAGIYGMNFESVPALDWRFGFHAAIGFMGLVCAALWWRFRKNDWL